jgi:hypothetical protein
MSLISIYCSDLDEYEIQRIVYIYIKEQDLKSFLLLFDYKETDIILQKTFTGIISLKQIYLNSYIYETKLMDQNFKQ